MKLRILNTIQKTLNTFHKHLSNFFYLLYLIVSDPKQGLRFISKTYISKIKEMDYRSIFKFKYLIIIWRLFLYFNALFGAGIIIYYTNPLNDLINSIMNFIQYYNDNIFIKKFREFLSLIKKVLDSLSEWIGKITDQDNNIINQDNNKTYNFDNVEIKSVTEQEIKELKTVNSESESDNILERKEYNQTKVDNIKSDDYKLLKYTLGICAIILVIGVTYYYKDTLLTYFTSKSNTNTNTNSTDLPDNNLSNNNSSQLSSPENNFNIYFKSPDSTQNNLPDSTQNIISDSGTSTPSSSSGSSTITLASKPEEIVVYPKIASPQPKDIITLAQQQSPELTSPEPLKIIPYSIKKYNPSYPLPDDNLTPVKTIDPLIPVKKIEPLVSKPTNHFGYEWFNQRKDTNGLLFPRDRYPSYGINNYDKGDELINFYTDLYSSRN